MLRRPSEGLQFAEAGIDLSFFIELVIVVSTKIAENLTVLKHVVDCNQHGMSNRDIGTLSPASGTDSLKLRTEIRAFDHGSRMCAWNHRSFQKLISLCCFAGTSFSSTLVIAERQACP